MKKSIAFLGALLFGSVTFAQVTKNENTNKPSSRKVSAEDLKKFPEDVETTTNTGEIKGELLEKHKGDYIEKHKGEQRDFQKMTFKHATLEKHSPDASAVESSEVKGTVTQKGKGTEAMTTEKQHYTIKLTNANKKVNPVATEQTDNGDGEATIQKKHVSNIKWTPGKVAKDSLATPVSKTSGNFIKIGDIKGEKEK